MSWNQKSGEHQSNATEYLEHAEQVYAFQKIRGLYQPDASPSEEQKQNNINVNVAQPISTTKWTERISSVAALIGVFLSVATIVFVYFTVVFSAGQWIQARRTADSSVDAANAAASAAKTASATLRNQQSAFEIDQRPYVVIESNKVQFLPDHFPPGDDLQVNISIKNIGRTPARNYLIYEELVRFESPKDIGVKGNKIIRDMLDTKYAEFRRTDERNRLILSRERVKEDVAPNDEPFTTNTGKPKVGILPEELSKLVTGNIVIYNLILITYRDSFNNRYGTEYCSVYFGTDPKVWHICPLHNEIK